MRNSNYHFRQIFRYSTASTSEASYIIGGYFTEEVIAEFKNDAWQKPGTLRKPRNGPASILLDDEIMVIGGHTFNKNFSSDLEIEIWNFKNEKHKVITQSVPNGHFWFGIGLYIVPFDFCTT